MDVKFLGCGAALVGALAVYAALIDANSTGADIPKLLKAANPEIADADVALDGCQLSIRNDQKSSDNLMASMVMIDVDLRMFDFEHVQIATKVDGTVALRIQRAPGSPELVEQVAKVMALLPATLVPMAGAVTYVPGAGGHIAKKKVETDPQKGWTKPQLSDFLSQPNSTLTIRLDGVHKEADGKTGARIFPHEDAPKFYGFADAIAHIDAPKTVSSALVFAGDGSEPSQLLSGLVAIPNTLVLHANSQIGARALAQSLLDYKQTHCSI